MKQNIRTLIERKNLDAFGMDGWMDGWVGEWRDTNKQTIINLFCVIQ